MSLSDYQPPVSELLVYGPADYMTPWPDYLALGLCSRDVPELIRMALDDELHMAWSDTLEVWGPVHAWRALGQLRAESAIEPLLGLLTQANAGQDEWVGVELPEVFGLLGAAAVPALAAYLADAKRAPGARATAADSLCCIAEKHPEARGACVSALARQLAQSAKKSGLLRNTLTDDLVRLHVVETDLAAARLDTADPGCNWTAAQALLEESW